MFLRVQNQLLVGNLYKSFNLLFCQKYFIALFNSPTKMRNQKPSNSPLSNFTWETYNCRKILFCFILFGCTGSLLRRSDLSSCGTRAVQLQRAGSRAHGLSSCGTQAQLPRGRWDLSPPTRDRTASLALEDGFLTTGPPGKSSHKPMFKSTVFNCEQPACFGLQFPHL